MLWDKLLAYPQWRFRHCHADRAVAHRARWIGKLWPAALFAVSIIPVNCSGVPRENTAEAATPANYGVVVSNVLKSFKDWQTYTNFEISDLRWVHATTGWNWLVCVRYDDHGHRRTYAIFLNDNGVVNQRYDTLIDRCGAQKYLPLDVTTGAIRQPEPEPQSPLY